MDQPDRAGLDAVLRRVLPLGPVSAPDPHQRLPDALGSQQVPPVHGTTPAPASMAAGYRRLPAVLRALDLDHSRSHRLVIKMTRAVRTARFTYRSVGTV